ncbi:MAG: glutamate racemase [Proteobacteria bacterium]|nr:glutamate racemase [Pseudomonadota bacterium]
MAPAIGICDSGSGGLTVLGACGRALPGQAFVYFGDHAKAPYGGRPEAEILELSIHLVEQLFKKGIRLVLLACNTSSAIALRQIQEQWLLKNYPGRRVLGVLVPMVEALTGLDWDRDNPGLSTYPNKTVAVFATERTVDSGAYAHQVRLRAPGFQVVQQACPGLVAAIEEDRGEAILSDLVQGFCQKLKKKMIGEKLDAVLLGCTHYPLVEKFFSEALPSGVEILSQPEIVAKSLKAYLRRHPEFADDSNGTLEFFTTGNPAKLSHLEQFMPGQKLDFKPL